MARRCELHSARINRSVVSSAILITIIRRARQASLGDLDVAKRCLEWGESRDIALSYAQEQAARQEAAQCTHHPRIGIGVRGYR